jgi:toxin ParE1/3/4
MSDRLIIRPQADRDVAELADYIAENSFPAAIRFLDSFDSTLQTLLRFPEIAAVWETKNPRYDKMRCWPVSGFPHHLIFYRPLSNEIEVIRVCHSSRDLNRLFSDEGQE